MPNFKLAQNPIPRVAAIHDLSGYGRSSLTVVLPVLSSMGINVCPLPTAVLSTQTSGFEDYVFQDLSPTMDAIVQHWKTLPLSFDSIYSGFLGSVNQIEIMDDLLNHFNKENQLIVVDPVMGDDGEFYGPIDETMIAGMKKLSTKANLITPNFTEASFLLGREQTKTVSLKEATDMLKALSALGPEMVIITSIPIEENPEMNTVLGYESQNNRFWRVQTKQIPVSYPGTGDMFASVITGRLLQGDSLASALDRAVQFIIHSMSITLAHNTPLREGVLLEKSLHLLMAPEERSICELLEL